MARFDDQLHEARSRTSEVESFLYGLIDVLVDRGLVGEAELGAAAGAVLDQLEASGEVARPPVALRDDDADRAPPAEGRVVDCAARYHVCQAVCCKLRFPLSAAEVEAGVVKWDLGLPYHIRREADGLCTHLDRGTFRCGVYEDRPTPCRQYSCADDPRIWKDFDNMIRNDAWQGWFSDHALPEEAHLVPVVPVRRQPRGAHKGNGGHPSGPPARPLPDGASADSLVP